MEIELHVHKQKFQTKPNNPATINNEVTEEVLKVTPVELAEKVGNNGQTMVLATMNGKRSKLNMVQQQALALDFDNKDDQTKAKTEGMFYQSIEDTLNNPFVKENASFIYKTFSHTEGWDKFRVVFILDKPLTTNEEVAEAYASLMDLYPNADKATKDSSRLFYGGTEAIEINFNNVLDVTSLPAVKKSPEKPVKAKVKKTSFKKVKPTVVTEEETPTWKLIKQGEKELVTERLNVYSVKLHSKVQAINYLKSLDMAEVLGVRFNPTFDFFHFENNPSASIFKMEDSDIYLYKCHSASHPFTGNIIHVIGKLTGLDYIQSLNYLIEVAEIKIEVTEQISELREQCTVFQHTLLSEDLKDDYPAIHTRLWRYKTDINAILEIFKENIYEDENGELRSLTWMSSDNLSLKLYGTKEKSRTIRRILNLMSYTEWIEKLDESQIPARLLEQIKKNQNSNGYSRRSNVFELFTLGTDFFTGLNKKCEVMAEQGFTMKGFSKEYVLNADGVESADKLYVQEKNRGISKTSEDITADIYQLVDFHLEQETHIVIGDLLEELTAKWKSKNLVETKFKQVLPKLLKDKNLQKSRLTKALREKWDLPSTQASPAILYVA